MLPAAYTCPHCSTLAPGGTPYPATRSFLSDLLLHSTAYGFSEVYSCARMLPLTPGTYTYPEVTTLMTGDLQSPHDLPCARRLLLRSGTYIYLCGAFSPPAAYSCVPEHPLIAPATDSAVPSGLPYPSQTTLSHYSGGFSHRNLLDGKWNFALAPQQTPLTPHGLLWTTFSQQPSLASADRLCSPINTFVPRKTHSLK